ncbi:MAG: AAA family ATPase [Acidobacteriota bacterium]|nr:AAA family ATPase [Acidobacteriota bacterium]
MSLEKDLSGRGPGLRLDRGQLRWRCDSEIFGFESTAEIGECPITIIGQPRAMDALRLGLDIRSEGYNIFVAGEVGTGRSTAVREVMATMERDDFIPEDLAYVHNFKDRDRPRLLAFPAGRGRAFAAAMRELIAGLQKSLHELFESDAYRERRAKLVEEAQEGHKARLKGFETQVQEEGFTLVQVQMGPMVRPGLMPVVAGNPVEMDQLEKLAEEGKFARGELEKIKTKHGELSGRLASLFKDLRGVERGLRDRLAALDRGLAQPLVAELVEEVREAFDTGAVREYLAEVAKDLLDRLDRFRELAEGDIDRDKIEAARQELTLPYTVNVIVDNTTTKGRPIIWESSPSYRNLFGTTERVQDASGQWRTDHTRIKSGSFPRANGGILVLDALDLLVEPGVWPTLKRTLRTGELEIHSFDPLSFFASVALSPEPVPLDVKVVLIGTRQIYQLLYALDEDFKKIFKVKADFALWTPLSEDELANYACFVHKKCEDESLAPFHRDAVAAVVEEGVRIAGRQQKLTTRFKEIAEVIREAGYWARRDGAEQVQVGHIDNALEQRRRRLNLIEEVLRERVAEGTLLLDLEGEETGQVNGLAVLDVGDYSFGQPTRITAVTAMGRTGILDIERESEMSGAIHTKGVLILAGFLRDRFAQDKPLALSASLAFEQSYGLVEGDSASSAELYALLSSLAEVPIHQGIAVTGSVNQKGEVQPIGGVNQKIEGYFDLCALKNLKGGQGVLIPEGNRADLMLRKDVVEAVERGEFFVWAVGSIEEGIEILTGVVAGKPGSEGTYPPDSIFGRVDAKLRELAAGVRDYGPADLKM